MKELTVTVKHVKALRPDVYLLTSISPYLAKHSQAGQFIHVKIPSDQAILRRPLSIHAIKGHQVTLLFRVRGVGTQIISKSKPGEKLNVLGPLGKGFVLPQKSACKETTFFIAGGMGVAPLVFLADAFTRARLKETPTVLLGAASKHEVLALQEFKKRGYPVMVATDDGSCGRKGTVVELLKKQIQKVPKGQAIKLYACGPKAMLRKISTLIKRAPHIQCQVSFEQFMGCGVGMCCACTIATKQGYKKVCKDGPVFDLREIW